MTPQEIPSGFAGWRCLISVRTSRPNLRRKHEQLWAQKIGVRMRARRRVSEYKFHPVAADSAIPHNG